MARFVTKKNQLSICRTRRIHFPQQRFSLRQVFIATDCLKKPRRQKKLRNRRVSAGFGKISLVRRFEAKFVITIKALVEQPDVLDELRVAFGKSLIFGQVTTLQGCSNLPDDSIVTQPRTVGLTSRASRANQSVHPVRNPNIRLLRTLRAWGLRQCREAETKTERERRDSFSDPTPAASIYPTRSFVSCFQTLLTVWHGRPAREVTRWIRVLR